MKYLITLCFVLFASITNSFAQDEVTSEPMQEEETVRVFKDPRLDILETRPALIIKAELETKAYKAAVEKSTIPNVTKIDAPIKQGKKLITGTIVTKSGFRVVIYNGSDRTLAMQTKNNFGRTFSSVHSYMTYNAPSYKIKVGDFETKKEAQNFLRRVGAVFPTSFIAPDLVTVKNINIIRE
jgi:hypothetical protein